MTRKAETGNRHSSSDNDDDEAGTGFDSKTEQLRKRIAALLGEVSALRAATRDNDMLEDLVVKLRNANQDLVVATMKARTMRDEVEAANRRQTEFLAMLAHELHNPLAPIGMAAALLEKVMSQHPQLSMLPGVIHRQVEHMAHLLDDLLDASRINSGKITLVKRAVLLIEIVERALETSQPYINERKQQLKISVLAEAAVIDGDGVRLAQVFSNLLVNAAKFTSEQGLITLFAERQANHLVVTVEDNGAGIAPEIQPYIFDLFAQGPRSLARSEGGFGIELSVVRSLH